MTYRPAKLKPVDDSDVALVLVRKHGVEYSAAMQLVENGYVFTLGDAHVVAGLAPEPLLGIIDAFVAHASQHLLDSEAGVETLVAAIQETWPEARRFVVRRPPEFDVAMPGFVRHTIWVAKEPDAEAPTPAVSSVIRAPVDAEQPIVRQMLVRAMVAGYAAFGRPVDEARVRAYVDDFFPTFAPTGPVSALVAVDDGDVIGHITWSADVVDELTGETFTELVDVLVADTHGGRGLASALVASAERETAPLGHRLLGHVVVDAGGHHEEVLDRLLGAGWLRSYDLWVCG